MSMKSHSIIASTPVMLDRQAYTDTTTMKEDCRYQSCCIVKMQHCR